MKSLDARGTLHIHPSDELRSGPRRGRAVVGDADYVADFENVEAVVAAIGEALAGKRLTREELADAVVERVGACAARAARLGLGLLPRRCGDRRRALLRAAAGAEGDVRPSDDWLGAQESREPAEALREVARRYLAAYGPATYRQFR